MEQITSFPIVPRVALMRLFDHISPKRLLFIHAPAGYGKTFSVRMWLSERAFPGAWVSVTESSGSKAADFCQKLTAALFALQPGNVLLKDIAAHKSLSAAPFEFAERAIGSFSLFAHNRPGTTLVIDDFHLITNIELLKRMPGLLLSLPENTTLCVLSRNEPPESFSGLVLKDAMAIVGAHRLKFSQDEVKAFFASCGRKLNERQVCDVMAATDGWAIGLNAILLSGGFSGKAAPHEAWRGGEASFNKGDLRKPHSDVCTSESSAMLRRRELADSSGYAAFTPPRLSEDSDAQSPKAGFRRSPKNHKLLSYLEIFIKEQIWDKWDDARRDFLLRVSVVDEFTEGFCAAVTGRKDSASVLDALVKENAFISVDNKNVYRFHHLFQDFLRQMLRHEKRENEFFRKAGGWFYRNGDYYRAVEYYIKCGDKRGITKGLKLMYDYNSPYAAIENTLSIIHLSIDGSIVDKYPFLLEVQAWTAYVEGRGPDMEHYLDCYFKQLPKIILHNPASAQTALLLRCMDYRNSMVEVTNGLKTLPLKFFAQANTPSISQNMPLFHRSSRDFSEYIHDTDRKLLTLKKTIGVLVGDECEMMLNLINAGLAYERGELNKAYEFALSANALVKDSFAPEMQFCSFMLLATVLTALGHYTDAQKTLAGAEAMIERHKAYYLNANFRAFSCRLKLADGDLEAARSWLNYREPPHSALSFYKLYQHFTTARAYLVAGEYNTAILFLKKLLALCEQYRRPLDIIEANILLAIAYWNKVRGAQNAAFEPLTKAIILAGEYGCEQIFADEGVNLTSMLNKLQKRVIQKDYSGNISPAEVKTLYYTALEKAKRSSGSGRGLTGGRIPENLKFTKKQMLVMQLLNNGLTQKEIAEKMGLRPSSVKVHVTLIYKKLKCSNVADAIIKIRELNVLVEE